MPANRKLQQFLELAVDRIVNGEIAELWDLTDGWGANIQAGFIDPSNWSGSAIRPAAVNLQGGVREGESPRRHGEPSWTRSWIRRIQQRQFLFSTCSNPRTFVQQQTDSSGW